MAVSAEYQIFHDIINYKNISSPTAFFFKNLKEASANGTAENIARAINRVLKRNVPAENSDFMLWLELLLNIHIIKWHQETAKPGTKIKNPLFDTFSCTFEHPALYPEYWFELPADKKTPAEFLTAFDRYMYDCCGGDCWGAVDFNQNKFVFRCICEPEYQKPGDRDDPCAKIASLIMAAHRIVNGRLGLYIGEASDISLQYAGLRNDDPAMLKYFHYDRYTRLSYCRRREKQVDADTRNPHPEFSLRSDALAAMTEFSLQQKSARATTTTASRVSVEVILHCLEKLHNESTIKKNARAMSMLEKGIRLLDDEDFASMSVNEVLSVIHWEQKFITPDFYLKKHDIRSAEAFWTLACKVFDDFLNLFNDEYYALIHSTAAAEKTDAPLFSNRDSQVLLECLLWNQMQELRGRLTGLRLREALHELLVSGELEWHSRQLTAVLNRTYKRGESFRFYNPQKGRRTALEIPCHWLCSDVSGKEAPGVLDLWARNTLTAMTRDKKGEPTLNFLRVDFEKIREASDKIWRIYFSEEYARDVKRRYIISILTARELLAKGDKDYNGVKLVSGSARDELLRFLSEELVTLAGGEVELEKEKEAFSQKKLWCYADFTPTRDRNILILDVLARLIVNIAKNPVLAAVWENTRERVRFVYHMLTATHSTLHPYPWHIGVESDAVFRISRSYDQRDHISRLVNLELENNAEQMCFLMSIGKYLTQEENSERILQNIIDNPALSASSSDRLEHLKDF